MNNLFFIIKTILIVCVVVFFSFCKGGNKASNKSEGIIEFQTSGVDEKHPFYGLVPTSATLKFKNDRFIMEMSTMGLFNISIIGDIQAKTLAQTIRYLDIKQACVETEKEIATDNKNYELKIDETNITKKIAGLKCYKLRVTMAHNPKVTYDIWYTKELGMENCNALSPYHEVKGVLMDYRAKKMGIEIHFVAKSYKHNEIPPSSFEIPASLKIISKDEMEKWFAGLLQ